MPGFSLSDAGRMGRVGQRLGNTKGNASLSYIGDFQDQVNYVDTDGYSIEITIYEENNKQDVLSSLEAYNKDKCYTGFRCTALINNVNFFGFKSQNYSLSNDILNIENYYFAQNNNLYHVELKYAGSNLYKTNMDQILSTFKFSEVSTNNQLSFSGSLQDYLIKNCSQGNPYSISIANLPVKINTSVIVLGQRPDNIEAFCSSTSPDKVQESYIDVPLKEGGYLEIYDSQSNELGHGGPPFLGQFGTEVYRQGNTIINAFIGIGEGPSLLGYIPIKIRGQKEFVTQSGQSIFVNLDETAINGSDQRLKEYLTPFSREEGFDQPVVDTVNLDSKTLINKFFSKLTIGSPEALAVETMKKKLDAISVK